MDKKLLTTHIMVVLVVVLTTFDTGHAQELETFSFEAEIFDALQSG